MFYINFKAEYVMGLYISHLSHSIFFCNLGFYFLQKLVTQKDKR